MIPTNQIIIVLVTSANERARAFTYFVTDTPHKLKSAIEQIPIIINIIREGLFPASIKYCSGLSR